MRCVICDRKAEEKFCHLHKEAYNNVAKNYEGWRRSMEVSWEEYLDLVAKNPNTGLWAKEVVEYLLKTREG